MSEDNESQNKNPGGIIKQTIDSATALSKAVPIYEDAVQPLAKETGKALGTLGKAVNVALAPISVVVWGYDQMKDFLENKVTEREYMDSHSKTLRPQKAWPSLGLASLAV